MFSLTLAHLVYVASAIELRDTQLPPELIESIISEFWYSEHPSWINERLLLK